MSHTGGNDMRLDDSEANSGSGTSPSNGGGSQDSIDSYITQIIDDYLVYLKVLGKNHEDAVKATVEYDRPNLTDWHNTQLKATLRTIHKTIVDNDVAGPVKWQVEDMQSNLEKQWIE